MAHKKGGGSSTNGRDSHGQRLGIKRFGGQLVTGGSILIRQRGTRYKAGRNVSRAKDDSLFATITGVVRFEDKGALGKFISVFPAEESRWVAPIGLKRLCNLQPHTKVLTFNTRSVTWARIFIFGPSDGQFLSDPPTPRGRRQHLRGRD